MEAGASQLQSEDRPEPAEGTVEGVAEGQPDEGQLDAPVETTFDPETGNLAQPEQTEPLDDDFNDSAEDQADGEAANNA